MWTPDGGRAWEVKAGHVCWRPLLSLALGHAGEHHVRPRVFSPWFAP